MTTPLSSLVTSLKVNLQMSSQKAGNLKSPAASLVSAKEMITAFGTGLNNADLVWDDRRLVAFGADDELDLAGTLENDYGDVVTFANVKLLMILNRTDEDWSAGAHTATTAVITVGGAISEFLGPFGAAGDKISIPTGGLFLVTNPGTAGWTVTEASADDLKIHNDDGANEAMYDIIIIGESA